MKPSRKALYKTWFLAVRPKTLWAAVAPVIMGTGLALHDGGFHLLSAVLALFGALMIQAGTNLANDYYDFMHGADTEERKGPTRLTQAGLVPPAAMRKAFIFSFTLAALAGIYLLVRGGLPILVIGLSSIAAGILYTGGPRPYGYSGLGEIFVLCFFGPVAVGGTYYVQTLTISGVALAAGIAPGLLSTAILVVNNLRDRTTDGKTGKKTLAVRYGPVFARTEYLICILGSFLVPMFLIIATGSHYYCVLTAGAGIFLIPSLTAVMTTEDGPALNAALAGTGRTLLIYSLLFSLGWNL